MSLKQKFKACFQSHLQVCFSCWLSSLVNQNVTHQFYCLDYFFQLPNVVCWSNADTSLFSIVLLVYHHWNHALPPAVSSYACCFSLHAYTIIYLYTYTYQSYSAPSCQSNQAHPHKPPLQSPILPAIEHRDWPRRCERHLNDLKFETLEIGGNRITWLTHIALTSWVIYFCKLLNDPEHTIYNSCILKWIMSWYIVLGSGSVAKLIKMDQWWSMEVCFTSCRPLFSIQAQGFYWFPCNRACSCGRKLPIQSTWRTFNNWIQLEQVSYCRTGSGTIAYTFGLKTIKQSVLRGLLFMDEKHVYMIQVQQFRAIENGFPAVDVLKNLRSQGGERR